MDDMHPIVQLLNFYYEKYSDVRTSNADLSNIDFHQRYGLYLNGPMDWPYVEAIQSLIDGTNYVTIVYSSTDMYRKIYKGITSDEEDNKRIGYVSFSDMFYAIHRDSDLLSSIKQRLRNSDLVICAGSTGVPDEVITQIKAFSDGCLIMLG